MKLNIKQLRKKKKLSQLQLSKMSGVARGYINELESGKYDNPGAKILCAICKALDCTLNELIDCGGEEDGNKDI